MVSITHKKHNLPARLFLRKSKKSKKNALFFIQVAPNFAPADQLVCKLSMVIVSVLCCFVVCDLYVNVVPLGNALVGFNVPVMNTGAMIDSPQGRPRSPNLTPQHRHHWTNPPQHQCGHRRKKDDLKKAFHFLPAMLDMFLLLFIIG